MSDDLVASGRQTKPEVGAVAELVRPLSQDGQRPAAPPGRARRRERSAREWTRAGCVALLAAAAAVAVAKTAGLGVGGLAVSAIIALALVRVGATGRRIGAVDRFRGGENVVILGAGDVGQLVARELLRHPEYGMNVVGFVDSAPKRRRADVTGVPILGSLDDLVGIIQRFAVNRVIVAFSRVRDDEILDRARALLDLKVRVNVVPRLFEVIGPASGLPSVEGIPLVGIAPPRRSAVAVRLKRLIDVVVAGIGLVLAAPMFLWAAWRIPRETPGPVLFRQRRLGEGMAEFTMLKFRTMRTDTDEAPHRAYVEAAMNGSTAVAAHELHKLDRDDSVTPTGRWLRRTSLDELPQLINVLQGTMSLVGPRPCLAYETEHFAPHHYERFRVRPGITGLWQVRARGHASFAEALEMDVAYVRDWSLRLDLALLVRTPAEVVRQRKATV